MQDYTGPDFTTWTPQNLANFARDAYVRMQTLHEELEQARLTLLRYAPQATAEAQQDASSVKEDDMEMVAEVHTEAEFLAAVSAMAKATYEEARKHPFALRYNSTVFQFKEGVHDSRVGTLRTRIAQIKRGKA